MEGLALLEDIEVGISTSLESVVSRIPGARILVSGQPVTGVGVLK